ncbi:MAG: hypothetical protein ACYSR4_02290 [Planctomycetota bacterium]|jgi:hypothetical protein
MHRRLHTGAQTADNQVRVCVTGQKEDLEEQHTGGPHLWASSEPREDVFSDERLHLKQKKRTEKDGQRISDDGVAAAL